MQFLNTVDTLIGKAPKYLEVIMGTHINSNIVNSNDIHGTDFQPTLRLHSLPWCNKKGKNLLHFYLAH